MEVRMIVTIFDTYHIYHKNYIYGLPQRPSYKESTCNAGDTGDMGSVPE